MEDALRSLLERLSGVATGAAHSHDKPVNIVEELKDALDYLAEDEHPAASAVFLSKVRAPASLVVRIQSAHPTPTGSALPRRRALDVIPRAFPAAQRIATPFSLSPFVGPPRRASSPPAHPRDGQARRGGERRSRQVARARLAPPRTTRSHRRGALREGRAARVPAHVPNRTRSDQDGQGGVSPSHGGALSHGSPRDDSRRDARAGCRPPRRLRTPQEQHRESQVEHTVRHRSLARCRHSPGSTCRGCGT